MHDRVRAPGWTIAKVFKDNDRWVRVSFPPHPNGRSLPSVGLGKKTRTHDRSASRYATKERPRYEKLIAFLKQGSADVLVTWESSRAQRDLEAYLKLRTTAESNGMQWSYKGRLYDLTRTDDRFTTGLDALLDEREPSITRDGILRAKRGSALKGRPPGRRLVDGRRFGGGGVRQARRAQVAVPYGAVRLRRRVPLQRGLGGSAVVTAQRPGIAQRGPVAVAVPGRLYAAILKARIKRGDWQPNRAIPSEARLVQEYGPARTTVRRTIALLVEEGVVYVVPQRGTFVAERSTKEPGQPEASAEGQGDGAEGDATADDTATS